MPTDTPGFERLDADGTPRIYLGLSHAGTDDEFDVMGRCWRVSEAEAENRNSR